MYDVYSMYACVCTSQRLAQSILLGRSPPYFLSLSLNLKFARCLSKPPGSPCFFLLRAGGYRDTFTSVSSRFTH